jgi:hypothetical protein
MALSIGTAVMLLSTGPSWGSSHNDHSGDASPSPTGNGVDISAGQTAASDGSNNNGARPDPCTSTPVQQGYAGSQQVYFTNQNGFGYVEPDNSGFDSAGNYIPPGTAGMWYLLSCPGGQSLVFAPTGHPVDPAQVAQMLRSHLALPGPAIEMMPAVGHWQYVQVPSMLWVA